jgi:hypothetical protein
MDEKIKGKRIMVVNDESDLTLFLSMSLEYHGFEVMILIQWISNVGMIGGMIGEKI